MNSSGFEYKGLSVFYQKVILYGVLPLILSVAALIIWIPIFCCRRNFRSFKEYFISSVVTLIFLVYPSIAKVMFASIHCIEIDGVNYLREDISQVCFKGQHLAIFLAVSLPSILIWCVGFPLYALIFVLKHKKLIS
jgi:hypothetical protein